MSPQLLQILDELSLPAEVLDELRTCLLAAGFVHPRDSNLWDDQEECAGELSPGNEIIALFVASVWRSCDRYCQRRVRSAVADADTRPEFSLRFGNAADQQPVESFVTGAPRPKGASRKRVIATPAADVNTVKRSAAVRPVQVVQKTPAVAAAHHRLSLLLWAVFIAAGAASVLWADYDCLSECDQKSAEELFHETHAETSTPLLRRTVSHLRRWREWTRDHESCRVWQPSPFFIQLWLRSLRACGSTVPASALESLKWAESYLGIVFHVKNAQVLKQSHVPGSHELVAATPTSLKIWLHWEELAASANPFVAWIACIRLLILLGVLRFAHVQRSRIVQLERLCTLG